MPRERRRRRTRGLITAPTGPTLVLLASALAASARAGRAAARLWLALAVTIAAGGLLQAVIALAGGGRLIKYIPFPVVSGFMTGSAILMVLSQVEPLRGDGAAGVWSAWAWLPAASAAVTMAGTWFAPRLVPGLPGPIAGLVLGTLVFHASTALVGTAPPASWMIGTLPGFSGTAFTLDGATVAALPWTVILPAALALAVLASLDTLLTAVVADVATGTRHDSRRELVGQGCGQIASALCGGMAERRDDRGDGDRDPFRWRALGRRGGGAGSWR